MTSGRVIALRGNHFQIGQALGELARPCLPDYLIKSPIWAALQPWNNTDCLAAIARPIQQCLPFIWQELEGMAHALDLPVHTLLLWNCRADLLAQCDVVPQDLMETESSLSIALASGKTRWLAHQQCLYGIEPNSYWVDIRFEPDTQAPGFLGLYEPGCLPGGFAANHLGLLQLTDRLWPVNKTRPVLGLPPIPSAFLARAILDCSSLDTALHLLGSTAGLGGGLHVLLCSSKDQLAWSVEVIAGITSFEEIKACYVHSNHLCHTDTHTRVQHMALCSHSRYQQAKQAIAGANASALQRALQAGRSYMPPDKALAAAVFEIGAGQVKMHFPEGSSITIH